jgi:hypothetical protein
MPLSFSIALCYIIGLFRHFIVAAQVALSEAFTKILAQRLRFACPVDSEPLKYSPHSAVAGGSNGPEKQKYKTKARSSKAADAAAFEFTSRRNAFRSARNV